MSELWKLGSILRHSSTRKGQIMPLKISHADKHTKPLQAQEWHDRMQQHAQVPQFDGNLRQNICHKTVSYDKKSYTTTNSTNWIFTPTLLFFSKAFFLIWIYAKCVERFSKKIWHKRWQFSKPETVRYGTLKLSHDDQHGKTKKMCISDFLFLKLHHRDFCQTCWEIFKNHEIVRL